MRTRWCRFDWTTMACAAAVCAMVSATTTRAQGTASPNRFGEDGLRRALAGALEPGVVVPVQSSGEWAAVVSLKAGTETTVTLDDGSTLRGTLWAADTAGIRWRVNGIDRESSRDRITRVSARGIDRGGEAKKWAVVGMLTGIGVAVLSCRGHGSECVQSRGLGGTMLGLAGGAIFGASWPRWRDVYVK